MTDRLKGVLVTFDRDIREDDAKHILKALKMIKGVLKVQPYIAGMEDYMLYDRGHSDARRWMMDFLLKENKAPK